jgi:GTP cyclohydrolase I
MPEQLVMPIVDPNPVAELSNILLTMFGPQVWDDSIENTAKRILKFWGEYSHIGEEPFELTVFDAGDIGGQLIAVKDIEFSSICAHHLLPFYGKAHMAYVPHKKMVGLSKLPRIVDFFAKRPQVQERLTHEIASYVKDKLEAKGVAIVMEARHTCMSCRGVRKHNGAMVTSDVRGVFLTAPAARQEFLDLIARDEL